VWFVIDEVATRIGVGVAVADEVTEIRQAKG
jgi:hypothetical protein